MVGKDLGHINLALAHLDSEAWSTVRSSVACRGSKVTRNIHEGVAVRE